MIDLDYCEEQKLKIYTIRSLQLMLDSNLAELYDVEIKAFNQSVKRNQNRFPKEFMFQLNEEEYHAVLRSQIVTLKPENVLDKNNDNRGKHRKYLPFAFTEQGIAMLSAVLKSDTAVKVSIQIINAFVIYRKHLLTNIQVFQRLDALEVKQLKAEKKIDHIFDVIDNRNVVPMQGIFFDGEVFDAWKFVSDLVRSAEKSICLIDNYIDDSIFALFLKRKFSVKLKIYTRILTKEMQEDINRFTQQYPGVEIIQFSKSHDRFLIIDEEQVYHIGASLKDLGKKWFAFAKMEKELAKVLMIEIEKNSSSNS